MTILKFDHPFTQTLCLLVTVGCSSRIEVATATGGSPTAMTGGSTGVMNTTPSGGTRWGTGGGPVPTGGSNSDTGGAISTWGTGGSQRPTGGSPEYPTGGAKLATGGYLGTGGSFGTGGANWATGGAPRSYPNANCTYGMDQTCNDQPWVSAVYGQCQSDGYCVCNDGYCASPSTGKCTTTDQCVCYSPTQNIDKAYVDRAFGCNCSSTTDKPWCGIDSSGLRVYLACVAGSGTGTWQSGPTSNCGAGGAGSGTGGAGGASPCDPDGGTKGGADSGSTVFCPGTFCPDLNGNGVLDSQENLLPDSRFKTISGWSAETGVTYGLNAAESACSDTLSGSLSVKNQFAGSIDINATNGARACVAATASQTYVLFGNEKPLANSVAGVGMAFYTSTDCGAANSAEMPLSQFNASAVSPDGFWHTSSTSGVAPIGANSVAVRLFVGAPEALPSGVLASALFDNILLIKN